MPTSTEEARSLLERVLREPFEFVKAGGKTPDLHVHRWLNYLIRESPLWTWQPEHFSRLHHSALPTTYPLDSIIESIVRDDQRASDPQEPRRLGLLCNLFERRQGLADGRTSRFVSVELPKRPSRRLPVLGGRRSFHASDLHRFVPDAEPNAMAELNPYEDIGRDLVWLIDVQERARAAGDHGAAHAARADLDDFLRRIAVHRGRGRPAEGPSETIVQALVSEGRDLFELLWFRFPSEVSQKSENLLGEHGVAESERALWAVRLALPILSKPEIQALQSEVEQSANWTRASGQPTPRRLSVFVLAHRLGMEASTVARRATGGSGGAYEEFQGAVNPIDAFLPDETASDRQ
jgi:hypothetical protein